MRNKLQPMTLSHEAVDKLMEEFQLFVAESTASDLARPKYSVPVIDTLASQNQPVDSTRWDLQNGDCILLCSRFVYDSMLPTKLERFTARRLAESFVENARQAEPRFSHVVLAIEMNRIANAY
jgi:hypothetical protein